MKVYELQNYDGVNRAMVAALNLKDAAAKLGTSVYHMRQMGWRHPPVDVATIALARPGTALYQPIDARGFGVWPWRGKRYSRAVQGGWK
jgi:hypothetical protein